MNLSKIKLIVSEIDGIVTEHTSAIGEAGITMFKHYYMKDFEAINQIKKKINFSFLSNDASISMSLCRAKNIPFYYAKGSKRRVLVKELLKRYAVSPEEVIYIGSSYSDLNCMKLIPFTMCPDDAIYEVKEISQVVIPVLSGMGILCWLNKFLDDNRSIDA
jgi:3-deoxy-D-manno-octulosonate 8-phosphate phosphatase (KDO 8-P phosphatase)